MIQASKLDKEGSYKMNQQNSLASLNTVTKRKWKNILCTKASKNIKYFRENKKNVQNLYLKKQNTFEGYKRIP